MSEPTPTSVLKRAEPEQKKYSTYLDADGPNNPYLITLIIC